TGTDAQWETAVLSLGGFLAAVFAMDHLPFRQRSIMTRAALVVGGVNVAAALVLQVMGGAIDGGLSRLGLDLVCGFTGGLLAASLTSFAIPIVESAFDATTSIKLVELANPNLPLLRRLAFEAPGSFQHSLAVANLAKAGVDAIDGDPVLVHTGALYHDIGKVFRPHYFIENQPPGQNPHDKIQPSMSALILINHVKEGLELAEQNALPAPILDAIEQHHGTRLIKFFYERAKERRDPDTDEVQEEEFRYPGPKPQSKEMGVLMLADAVEAASRTLISPSRQKIRSVLRAVFDDCLRDHQLDQTDLTLGDLAKVEEAFQRVLVNIHHRRIDYPGFDFNRDGRAKKNGVDKQEAGKAGAAPSEDASATDHPMPDAAETSAKAPADDLG
ncbi:MAG: HDIG domain-containing metalloprotein, partial [Acidobacteriota bacterium]